MTSTDAFFEAIRAGNRKEVETLLGEEPGLAHTRDSQGLSPLLTAVYHRAEEVVQALRAGGAILDIHEAAATGDAARIRTLLAADRMVANSRSADGGTPLHLACYFGHTDAVQLLLQTGADAHAWSMNAMRNQPLHAAIAGARDAAIIGALLAAGADVNAAGGGGFTPLHLAASRGDIALIDELIARGAVGCQAENGQTPAEIAAERGYPEAAERFAERSSPPG